MSRVGKYPVIVPEGVNVAIEGNLVKASGKLGELSHTFDADHIAVELKDNKIDTIEFTNFGKYKMTDGMSVTSYLKFR